MGGNHGAPVQPSAAYPKYSQGPVGKQIHKIYKDRLPMFTAGGAYEHEMLKSKMYYACASDESAVKFSVWSAPDLERPTFEDATASDKKYKSAKVGDSFGPSWSTHWFRIHLTVSEEMSKYNHLEFMWDAGCEGMIWTAEGHPLQGLTGGDERVEWVIPEEYRDGKEHTIYVELACNRMFGNGHPDVNNPPDPNIYYTLTRAEICAVNLNARGLYIDFWQIGDAAREFPDNSWEEHEALQVCLNIMNQFIAHDGTDESIKECRKIAEKYIGSKVDSEEVYQDGHEELVSAVGHCHIDTCWLWPWAETKRKVARSWSNQCGLMERYPEHIFVCSQAQQFKWLEEYYPSVFDRVKEKVKSGQFQPIGGSWVEHDTNMPGGEALVRQFLYGQRFFESHFGERSTTFWLPDTFGYSPQIPQLSRLAGMPRFFTQKLSWNNINVFPHTTFNWVSLDGSQVLCHMTPAETYTAEAHFGDTMRCVTQHKTMDQEPASLLVFGKGDGGGGPTWQHLEKLRRQRGMAEKVGRLPRVGMGKSVDDFFRKLEKTVESGVKFPTWYGELYLELHRGTYTSQANNKRNNRKTEILLHDIEYLATFASIKDLLDDKKNDYKYPKDQIDELWENILLCQFHDCLPGSSIEMCYRDTDKLYAAVFATGEKLIAEALAALGFEDFVRSSDPAYAINTTAFARTDLMSHPISKKSLSLETIGHGVATSFPPEPATQGATIKQLSTDEYAAENAYLSIKISQGAITSIYDKDADREIIPEGARANQLVLYDDKPLYWQAWDVEVYHLDVRKELYPSSATITSSSPDLVSLTTHTKISPHSSIKMTISLSSTSKQITTSAEVDWHESHKFLKVETPVDILNTSASYETQFGIIKRATHFNTSWDTAKFEVCSHKFADLSETSYGVSILNESKYGFAVHGNVMRLSLLRAPKSPDGHADMGTHSIKWAILPHEGPLSLETVKAGYLFNAGTLPLKTHKNVLTARALLSSFQIDHLKGEGVVLSAVKRGEDDPDVQRSSERGKLNLRKGRSVVLRLYDALGGKCRVKVNFGALDVKDVTRVNLLEDDLEDKKLKIEKDGVVLDVKPFEVVSLRIWL